MPSRFKILLIILAAVIAVTGIIFAAVYHNGKGQNMSEPEMINEKINRVDDVTELSALLGKTPSEAGFTAEQLSEVAGYRVFKYEGKLFGTDAYGDIYFAGDERNGEKEADTVYILCSKMSFDDCRSKLIALYGEPAGEGEEPYAEVNGGALSWCGFVTDGLDVELTQGSNNNYFMITVKKNK